MPASEAPGAWLVRAWWWVGAATLLSGAVLAIVTVPPSNLLPTAAYDAAFQGHAGAGVVMLPLLLSPPDPRALARRRALWLIGLVVLGPALVLSLIVVPGIVGGVVGVAALVLACAAALPSSVPPAARASQSLALAILGLILLPGLLETSPHGGLEVGWAISYVPTLIAVGALARTAVEDTPTPWWPAAIAGLVVLAVSLGETTTPGLRWLAWLPGLGLAALAFRGAGRASSPWRRRSARLQAVLAGQAVFLTTFRSEDPLLSQTLFVSGSTHLAFAAGMVGWLSCLRPASVEPTGWGGLGAIAGGAHLLAYSHILLGRGGTPRRYVEYLPDVTSFVVLHLLAGLAAVLLVAGAVLVWRGTSGHPRAPTRF